MQCIRMYAVLDMYVTDIAISFLCFANLNKVTIRLLRLDILNPSRLFRNLFPFRYVCSGKLVDVGRRELAGGYTGVE